MSKEHADNPHRRDFFRSAAERLIEPVADFIEKKAGIAKAHPVLRPPGAVHPARFNETCKRCGECVKVCPADAIVPLDVSFVGGEGTPSVDPSRAPCVVCEGLLCTHVCPSGALLPVYGAHLIRMGLAEVYAAVCVRSNQDECTECVDRCPYGELAIRFDDDGPPTVIAEGCTGCGVCEFYCPTTPKAITIQPYQSRS